MKETELLKRIADTLDRLAPSTDKNTDVAPGDVFVWRPDGHLQPVDTVNRVAMTLLKGIDHTKDQLIENTEQFANGFSANNALLWGARGMGKSSLVKAVHHHVGQSVPGKLKLVEIAREDINTLPDLMALIRAKPDFRFIVFCDDLSFDHDDTSYKFLKTALDGGVEGRPPNALFYATSNRRHLMARDMIENERSTAINPSEAVEEKVSLSDRFGLWLGFHNCSQDEFLEMIAGYVAFFNLPVKEDEWRPQAIEWTATRGSRSGRVAWQFVQGLAGRLGHKIGPKK